MKLVDILALELKAWPEGVDSVWQSSYDNEIYFDADVPTFYTSLNAEDSGTQGAVITQAQWQAAVDALKVAEGIADAEAGNLIPLDDVKDKWASRSWNGEGLPPVGLDVEIKRGNCTWIDGDEWQIGKTATVMASFLNSRDVEMASVQFPGGHCECILARCLSPIRTAEQVAAEEREKAIKDMMEVTSDGISCIGQDDALALYKAGYSKEKKPCGF